MYLPISNKPRRSNRKRCSRSKAQQKAKNRRRRQQLKK